MNVHKLDKLFYNWLIVTFILVFSMIIIGGLTRLTNSGLSITEWELFKGILPPLSQSTWDKYFSLYKEIPQYKLLNQSMTLQEFKVIFYWEYFHRILGRFIGLFFLLPLIFFYMTKKIEQKYLLICLLIMTFIILQGFIGWYMVQSGLVNNVTVSHYRLSLHLSMAFIIIMMNFWIILNLQKKTFKKFFKNEKNNIFYHILILLIFLQIIFGAFVSGLDAGKIYQTWPLMNHNYFPNDFIIRNFIDFLDFESHSLVQFYHRNLAYLISVYIVIIGIVIWKNNLKELKKPFYLLFFFMLVQILLGIFTLVSGLNIYLASAHQICSLLLILSAINLYYNHIN